MFCKNQVMNSFDISRFTVFCMSNENLMFHFHLKNVGCREFSINDVWLFASIAYNRSY